MTMRILTVSTVLVGVLSLASAVAAPITWEVAVGGNGHAYEAIFLGSAITWESARSAAQALGGDLVTITSAAENAFVESLFSSDSTFFFGTGFVKSGPWIGAFATTNTSGDWAWIGGEPFAFADWGPSEPFGNGNKISYALFGGTTVGWNDIPSVHPVSPQSFILEIVPGAPVPEPTTALLVAAGLALMGLRRTQSR